MFCLDRPPSHGHLLAGTLPGRLSVYLHCWRATGPGPERLHSLSRRQTPGRLDWHTQAPATSQYDPLPSSAWNWVRTGDKSSSSHPVCLTHHCLTEHSCFFHLKFTKECTEVKHKWMTTNSKTQVVTLSCTYFPHQKLLRLRPLWSIFINTESTSM